MRKIIHVDMDCFYAAVEEKYRPELKGKPVGVGGPPESRSVLCTANYEARKYKVKSAMPSSQAVRLCPHIILVPPNFDLYKKESLAVREIFQRFTNLIEPLSLDEAYLDVTNVSHCRGSATLMAREIRKQIQSELQLTASAGIAPNKFLAKIASDWNKPNGQYVVEPKKADQFTKILPVEKIFGVGKVTAQKMHALGLFTCADIRKQSIPQLESWFGSRGKDLFDLAHGIDNRPVEPRSERKSLTVEDTFRKDLQTLEECLGHIPDLYKSWEERMQNQDQDKIKGIVVKIKWFDFQSTTHELAAKKWPEPRDFEMLLKRAWGRRAQPVRLIGIGVRLGTEQVKSQLSFPF